MSSHVYSIFLCTFLWPILAFAQTAQEAFEQGDFAQAIQLWQQQQSQDAQAIRYLHIAQAYLELGLTQKASTELQQAQSLIADEDSATRARWHLLHSRIALSNDHNQHAKAKKHLHHALELRETVQDPLLQAEILNHAGNIYSAALDYEAAIRHYQEALTLLDDQTAPALRSNIQLNLARNQTELDLFLAPMPAALSDFPDSLPSLQTTAEGLNSGAHRYQRVFAHLQLYALLKRVQERLAQPEVYLQKLILNSLQQAVKLAEQIEQSHAQAHSYAALSGWYLEQGQLDAALVQVRRALFFSAQQQSEWAKPQWLRMYGQILHQQQQLDAALEIYRRATDLLKPLRRRLANTGFRPPREFRQQIAPIYFERADLALQKAALSSGEQRNALLSEAQEAIENFKKAELQDYFGNPCITANRDRDCRDFSDLLDEKTAVLYPVILPERLELLLTLPDEQRVQKQVQLSRTQLQDTVALFLSPLRRHPHPAERSRGVSRGVSRGSRSEADEVTQAVCKPDARGAHQSSAEHPDRAFRFLPFAEQLYAWLIQPVEAELQARGIENLIIVPDSILRTVPFAALHNGEQYLIERYAIGISPSLCVSVSQPLAGRLPDMLLGGISEAVQGFEAIPCVAYELQTLHEKYAAQQPLLLNEDFQLANIQQSVSARDYAIVHIASHGEFNAAVDKSFILTYDGKLTLDKLEKLNELRQVSDSPIDLLTLSACETAKGNDRAALGLAGVALKAGARSVLASLWQVDDNATPAVVIEFYQQLQNSQNKVQALRQAQQQLLQSEAYAKYRHPYYWAAFLLLGDWH